MYHLQLSVLFISLYSLMSVAAEQGAPPALNNRPVVKMQQQQQERLKQRPRNMLEQRNGTVSDYLTTQQVGNKTVVKGVLINHGNVNVVGDEQAKAAGAQIEVENQDNVQVNAVLIQHGNVNATANSLQDAHAQATGTQVDIKGARQAVVNVKSLVHGNVTAHATGQQKVEAVAVGTQVQTDADYQHIEVNAHSGAAITAISQGQ